MLNLAQAVETILTSTIAGLVTTFITSKTMGTPPSKGIEQSIDITYSVTNNYVSDPHLNRSTEGSTSSNRDSGIFWVILVGIAILLIDRFYARHEFLLDMISLVAVGLGIGMLIPTLWTLYARRWLWKKAVWILGGWFATLYILWNFLFKRMPPGYYAQLESLRNEPRLTWTNFHINMLIAYRLVGWSITLVDMGMLIVASIGLFVMTGNRAVARFIRDLTEPRTGGLFVLIGTVISYGLVSGLMFSLLSHQ
ncbi:MAG: hypothetical protein OWT27_10970 [Firmicutes bacterium]|nr:hypothetical protein [Bacillota bacterium]